MLTMIDKMNAQAKNTPTIFIDLTQRIEKLKQRENFNIAKLIMFMGVQIEKAIFVVGNKMNLINKM